MDLYELYTSLRLSTVEKQIECKNQRRSDRVSFWPPWKCGLKWLKWKSLWDRHEIYDFRNYFGVKLPSSNVEFVLYDWWICCIMASCSYSIQYNIIVYDLSLLDLVVNNRIVHTQLCLTVSVVQNAHHHNPTRASQPAVWIAALPVACNGTWMFWRLIVLFLIKQYCKWSHTIVLFMCSVRIECMLHACCPQVQKWSWWWNV